MALDGQRQFVGREARTVVGDQDAGQPAAVGLHLDGTRTGVQSVFHQFLHGAGGTFDHLAGGDAVHGLWGKAAYRHGHALVRPSLYGDSGGQVWKVTS